MFNICDVKKDSISKNLIISCFSTPELSSICVDIFFLNILKLNKDVSLRGISLLESFSNQKNYFQVRKINLNSRIKRNIFNYYLRVTLRKNLMFNFFKFLNCFVFSEFKYTYYSSTKNLQLYSYKFLIKNIMIVRFLKSSFLQWVLPLHISINFNNKFVPFILNNKFI